MSSNAIDINDLDRLSAESRLTENAPDALPEQPNAVVELIKTLATMLSGRQSNEQDIQ